jgi:hypothetical protein
MMYPATSVLLLAYAHLGRLGGTRVPTRAVLMWGRCTDGGAVLNFRSAAVESTLIHPHFTD